MAKYHDRTRLGRSDVCPYILGESYSSRHSRRLQSALDHTQETRDALARLGYKLRVTNNSHHWSITDGRSVIQWWPSSAKIVINETWNRGIHAHDHIQLVAVVREQKRRDDERFSHGKGC